MKKIMRVLLDIKSIAHKRPFSSGFLILSITLVGCADDFSFSSNLDAKKIDDYFAPSNVIIYSSELDIKAKYEFVGIVEGEDCQQKAHYAPPNEINARTHARKLAFDLHANGIVFTSCVTIEAQQFAQKLADGENSAQCHATLVCYAKAYNVESLADEK